MLRIASTASTAEPAAAPERYDSAFLDPEERALAEAFLRDGHVVRPVEDRLALERIRRLAAEAAARRLGLAAPADPGAFLDRIHRQVGPGELNDVRLAVIQALNDAPWLRAAYYGLARGLLHGLVGNELAMQRRLNLSIQLPDDESSLLPVHADVWDGDSPYEVVVWLPLVDCHRSKSMFLLPPDKGAAIEARFADFAGRSVEALYREIEPDLVWLDVPFGHVLLFSQNLMHGNRVNREPATRWSMNCRFKSLLSPYSDKRLGEFFEPITVRPATRIGMAHRFPAPFDE